MRFSGIFEVMLGGTYACLLDRFSMSRLRFAVVHSGLGLEDSATGASESESEPESESDSGSDSEPDSD